MKTETKTEPKADTKLMEQLEAYEAAKAYVQRYASQHEDLTRRIEEIDAALVENEQLRGRPPAKILLDMPLADVKNMAGSYAQLDIEGSLLREKRSVLVVQLGNVDRNYQTFLNAQDDAKRDVWLAVYEGRLNVLKEQHGDLLLDVVALSNRLQKMPHELFADLLPVGEADTTRIDRMAAEFRGLPL